MTAALRVVSAFPDGHRGDARRLVFEYMAETETETGRRTPQWIGELPPVLLCECRNLPAIYHWPGALLIAYLTDQQRADQAVGCVGLAPVGNTGLFSTAVIKRLYVRPGRRGHGIARALMNHVHHQAAQGGIDRLVLDVLPTRTGVVDFYRKLGYTDTEPDGPGLAAHMVYLERLISSDDIQPSLGPS